jgi:hypothetical protein
MSTCLPLERGGGQSGPQGPAAQQVNAEGPSRHHHQARHLLYLQCTCTAGKQEAATVLMGLTC